MNQLIASICTFILIGAAHSSFAHRPDESYVYLQVFEDRIEGRVEIRKRYFNEFFGTNIEEGGSIEDVKDLPMVKKYILENLFFMSPEGQHSIKFLGTDSLLKLGSGDFMLCTFLIEDLSEIPSHLDITNTILTKDLTNHQSLVLIEYNWRAGILYNETLPSLIFTSGLEKDRLALDDLSVLKGIYVLAKMGIKHIWIGIDHILFLIALLIPSVVIFSKERGQAKLGFIPYTSFTHVESFRESFMFIIKVITLFTVAHSITLSLAVLDIIVLPSALVESTIALSIALAAIHNMWPIFLGKEWLVAFGFGLFHGFGFASILAEKASRGDFIAYSLFGFNLGVEIGQVVIIALTFPVLFIARKWKVYPIGLVVFSILVILISIYWFIERAFGIELLPGLPI